MKLSSFFTFLVPHKKNIQVFLFIGPAMIFLLMFWMIPILGSFAISFTDWDFMSADFHITGITNYLSLLQDPNFLSALLHTLQFAAFTVLPSLLLAFPLACLVRSSGKNSPWAALFLAPWITPTVAVSLVWTWIYEPDTGLANQILEWFGGIGIPWLHSSSTALMSVAVVTVWKNLAYLVLLYQGGLSRIPEECYEAAAIDGAGRIRRFFAITVPLAAPTTWFVGLVMTVESLRAYDQIQILTQGGPSGSTRTLLYLYYQLGFEQFRMGQAAAVVVILTAIGLILALLQNLQVVSNDL